MFGTKRTIKYYSIVIQLKDGIEDVKKVLDEIDDDNIDEEDEETNDEDTDDDLNDDDYCVDIDEDESVNVNRTKEQYFVGSHNPRDHVYDEYDLSVSDNFGIKNKILNFGNLHKNRLYLDEIPSATNDCSQLEFATPTLSKSPLLESEDEDGAENPLL